VERIEAFNLRYVQDWRDWMRVSASCDCRAPAIGVEIAQEFKRIMGKWQACRPKTLRSVAELQRTLASSAGPLALLGSADLRSFQTPDETLTGAVYSMWHVFEDGLCVQGQPTEVGVTKAILLVTNGRLGPAFDSNVKMKLNARYVTGPRTYLNALATVAGELAAFEAREQRSIEDLAAEAGRPAEVGRVVDMVLGPR
jgi:hypothetical protein